MQQQQQQQQQEQEQQQHIPFFALCWTPHFLMQKCSSSCSSSSNCNNNRSKSRLLLERDSFCCGMHLHLELLPP